MVVFEGVSARSYLEESKERILFISWFTSWLVAEYSLCILSEQQMDTLYAEFVQNAWTKEVRQIAISQLTEIIECDKKYSLMPESNEDDSYASESSSY